MTPSPPVPQPLAERRAADAELRQLVDEFAPDSQRLVAAVRRALRKRLPTAHEVVYEYSGFCVISFSPDGRGYEGVLAIRVDEDGVDLYFNRGKGLPDPEKLLRGSAKLVRFIHVDGASTLARPAVAKLIDLAIARGEVPFAKSGNGSVVVRSTAAKKRRK